MRHLLISAALVALAGSAAAAEPAKQTRPARSCFFTSQVSNFSAIDDRTVIVRVGVKDRYRLELFSPCYDIEWNNEIGITSRGSSSICNGAGAEIISPGALGPQTCRINRVVKLTPEEVEALPRRNRP